MPYALTQLAADIRETLKASPGRTGKRRSSNTCQKR